MKVDLPRDILEGGYSVTAVAAAQYDDFLVLKVIGSRCREQVQLWALRVHPVDEVVAKHHTKLSRAVDGNAEEDEVGIRGDNLGRQGQTLGFRACRAVDKEVREDWRVGGAESHRDGEAGTRLGRRGGGVAAGADVAKQVEQDGAWALALAARMDGSGGHGVRSIDRSNGGLFRIWRSYELWWVGVGGWGRRISDLGKLPVGVGWEAAAEFGEELGSRRN